MSFICILNNDEFNIFDEYIINKFHNLAKESYLRKEFELKDFTFKTFDSIPLKINISISKCKKIIKKQILQE